MKAQVLLSLAECNAKLAISMSESECRVGREQAEHARSTFAVVAQSRRVLQVRPRWAAAPPPAARRCAPPRPPLLKGRGRPALPPYSQFRSGPPRAAGDAAVYRVPLTSSKRLGQKVQAETEDVIDLGAPRKLRHPLPSAPVEGSPASRKHRAARAAPLLQPNPRLYPGPPPRVKPKLRPKLSEKQRTENRRKGKRRVDQHTPGKRRHENRRVDKRASGEQRRRRKKARRRVVPNERLYRAPPVRPPPARPAWRPRAPAPLAPLATASSAALRLSEQRARPAALVVSLPAALRQPLRSLDTDSDSPPAPARPPSAAAPAMDNRQSASPEDRSDGAETLSAPSEFLAEFLSAIMRRQYSEALKYCRLILQYEPHNATARGFYPLLQHKVKMQGQKPDEKRPRGSSSEEASAPFGDSLAQRYAQHKQEMMEQGGDSTEGSGEEEDDASRPSSRSGGSVSSQSSLEMDSSSPSLSRRTDSASASSGSASRSDADDNGNTAPATTRLATGNTAPAAGNTAPAAGNTAPATGNTAPAGDLRNDNAAAGSETLTAPPNLKGDSLASLRRLRAQFTCSIK